MDALVANALRPDNLPLLGMVPLLVLLVALWWRIARRHDRLLEAGGERAVREEMEGAAAAPARLPSWPFLVRIELLAALAVLALVTAWSILVDAPLEALADPARTPNPSKAPWYFLGLQEMLVYFDPWIAGVVLPALIVIGLSLIPYLDSNPEGNGFYCWRPRRFAIGVFLTGFLGLWIVPILVGVFCRGPGWGWYWPWQRWDPTREVQHELKTLAALLGVRSPGGALALGAAVVAGYYGLALLYWLLRRRTPALERLGGARFATVAFLLLTMLALPIKVLLRQALGVSYVWVTPWFSI
jgi:hypothetical protein